MNRTPSTVCFDVPSKRNPILNTNSLKQRPVLIQITADKIAVLNVPDKLSVFCLNTFPFGFRGVNSVDEGTNETGDGRSSEVWPRVGEHFLFCWGFDGAECFEDSLHQLIVHSMRGQLAND